MDSQTAVSEADPNFTEKLNQQIQSSIIDLENLLRIAPEASQYIEEIISTMKAQLKPAAGDRKSHVPAAPRPIRAVDVNTKMLKDIHHLYASQKNTQGNKPTFDQVERDKETLESGSFLKFARDYKLFDDKNVDEIRVLSKNELLAIFKKHARLQRDMNLDEFISALDSVAEEVFTEGDGFEVKRKNLYKYLRTNNPHPSIAKQPPTNIRRTDNSQRQFAAAPKAQVQEMRMQREEKKKQAADELARRQQEDKANAARAKKRLAAKAKMEEMKRNGDIIKTEDVSRISYGQLQGNDAELDDLIMGDDDSEDEFFNEQYQPVHRN